MKDKILDAPFNDEPPFQLDKGEVLLWEGEPEVRHLSLLERIKIILGLNRTSKDQKKNSNAILLMMFRIFALFTLIGIITFNPILLLFIVGIFFTLVPFYHIIHDYIFRNKYDWKYFITSQKVILLKKGTHTQTAIYFDKSKVADFEIEYFKKSIGNVFIYLKNQEEKDIEFLHFKIDKELPFVKLHKVKNPKIIEEIFQNN